MCYRDACNINFISGKSEKCDNVNSFVLQIHVQYLRQIDDILDKILRRFSVGLGLRSDPWLNLKPF